MMTRTLALLLLFLAGPQDKPNKAEELFREMEKKINSAKTVRFQYELEGHSNGPAKEPTTGAYLLEKGNRQNLSSDTKMPGNFTSSFGWISDGAKLYVLGDGQVMDERKAAGNLNSHYLTSFYWGGIWNGLLAPMGDLSFPQADELADFKLGRNQKSGRRLLRVLKYTIRRKKAKSEFHVTLWIDSRTLLPVKRTLGEKPGHQPIVETYSKFELDKKIDPAKFKPPGR